MPNDTKLFESFGTLTFTIDETNTTGVYTFNDVGADFDFMNISQECYISLLDPIGSSVSWNYLPIYQNPFIEKNNECAGLQEHDLLEAFNDLSPAVDWSTFLAQHVHTPQLPNYETALNSAGIYIKIEESTTPKTAQHFTQCLGVRFKEGSLIVSHVLHGRIAALSGVQVGDQWVALNHEQLKSTHWSEIFSRLDCDAYHDYNLHFFREGQLHTLALLRPQHTLPILKFHKLYQNTPVTAQQKNIASLWFNTGHQSS